jgi:hypothetical protein
VEGAAVVWTRLRVVIRRRWGLKGRSRSRRGEFGFAGSVAGWLYDGGRGCWVGVVEMLWGWVLAVRWMLALTVVVMVGDGVVEMSSLELGLSLTLLQVVVMSCDSMVENLGFVLAVMLMLVLSPVVVILLEDDGLYE